MTESILISKSDQVIIINDCSIRIFWFLLIYYMAQLLNAMSATVLLLSEMFGSALCCI